MLGLSGADELETVADAELLVDTRDEPVDALGALLPCLAELRLSDSKVAGIRDLGVGLSRLRVLWVARCGLGDLDGIAALPALEELYASFNDIGDTLPLLDLDSLAVLDLEGNAIASLASVSALASCPSLSELTLAGNPIASVPMYRRAVVSRVGRLELLDDERVTADDAAALDAAVEDSIEAAARVIAADAGAESKMRSGDPEAARLAAAMSDDNDEPDGGDASLDELLRGGSPDTPGATPPRGGRRRTTPRDAALLEEATLVSETLRAGAASAGFEAATGQSAAGLAAAAREAPLVWHLGRPATARSAGTQGSARAQGTGVGSCDVSGGGGSGVEEFAARLRRLGAEWRDEPVSGIGVGESPLRSAPPGSSAASPARRARPSSARPQSAFSSSPGRPGYAGAGRAPRSARPGSAAVRSRPTLAEESAVSAPPSLLGALASAWLPRSAAPPSPPRLASPPPSVDDSLAFWRRPASAAGASASSVSSGGAQSRAESAGGSEMAGGAAAALRRRRRRARGQAAPPPDGEDDTAALASLRARAARARARPTEPSVVPSAPLGTGRAGGAAGGKPAAEAVPQAAGPPAPAAPARGAGISQAVLLGDDAVLALLRRRPKEVPELRSRASFRSFFAGTPRRTMLAWLMAALQTDGDDARVRRRMELLQDVLA